ncbi:hypothetical protein acsn021_25080 [Anaerocolumna cellulosilytica]|uniref:Uncharacterized protein n=1 Tax=Anaerocolumna cellulosilytica TaxID=433286 RepID=A0A6S6R0T0_9FIRM|nr:DUF1292 domain-containing protein [Anaerocolumna cellulosilytica]MBB5193845.1 hypothetical protein [Anaerocolumna cellulosilytica]BCJ94939.1 hypothetical protein acsn021_25080 [Anaerocolumna cellulosilytica]
MDDKKNKITFLTDDKTEEKFYVLEQTKLNGVTYLLVSDTDEDEEEGDAYILKDMSAEEDEAALYEMVEDEQELNSIAKIFEELLEDIDIEI